MALDSATKKKKKNHLVPEMLKATFEIKSIPAKAIVYETWTGSSWVARKRFRWFCLEKFSGGAQ